MELSRFNKIVLQLGLFFFLSTEFVFASNYTGFLSKSWEVIATPIAKSYSGRRPSIHIKNPKNKIIIIYSHGTTRPQKIEDCSHWGNQVPQSILAIQGDNRLIYYLCSQSTEPNYRSSAGNLIYTRVKEIEKTLDELVAVGIQAKNIFLAGHSTGGWISLMAVRRLRHKFNSAIVFAPAFAGIRSEESQYPWWRRKVRPRQIREMLTAPKIKALVFAYYGDPFNRPQDLRFLKKHSPNSIQIVAYQCAYQYKHLTHLNDCRKNSTSQLILNYIKKMIANSGD
ncbi:MAG: hypothetical protein ACI86H_002676 [bacterium]|jgi:hypothetical protein